MKAKDYLHQVEKLDAIITNKLIEIEQWKSIALSTTARIGDERVQSSGSQDKLGDSVSRYIDIELEVNEYTDRLIDAKMNVIRTIEQLPAVEYDILHKAYIQYIPLDEIAAIKNKSYSWVTTQHGQALKHLQDILDRKGE